VPLTAAGEKLQSDYAAMLKSLRAKVSDSLPDLDDAEQKAFLKAHLGERHEANSPVADPLPCGRASSHREGRPRPRQRVAESGEERLDHCPKREGVRRGEIFRGGRVLRVAEGMPLLAFAGMETL
jgi:hypothetical protein